MGGFALGEHAQSLRVQKAGALKPAPALGAGPFFPCLAFFFPPEGAASAAWGCAFARALQTTTATTHTMAFPREKPSPGRGSLTSLSAGAALERDLAGGVARGRGFGLVGRGGVALRGIGGGAGGRGARPEFAGEDRAEASRAAPAAFSALLGMPTARFTPFEVCRRASRSAERCVSPLVAPVPSAAEPPDTALEPPPPAVSCHVVSLPLAPDAAGYVGIPRRPAVAPPPPSPRRPEAPPPQPEHPPHAGAPPRAENARRGSRARRGAGGVRQAFTSGPP